MKALDIALFFIFLLFSVNIMTASGIFGTNLQISFGFMASDIQTKVVAAAPQQAEEISYTELAISWAGLLVRSLVAILLILLYSTILLPYFLGLLGLPAEVVAIITITVWVSYILGYNQYRSRTPLQGTE